MDAPSSSLLSDASSAPPAENEPVMQEDRCSDKTAKERELAAAQQRLDALPMLKILSIMRKALPEDAHIDADVDEVMRTCVAKFAGVLTKEAKQQQTLARHKVLQSEDIISALQELGFEDSSAALSLFYSRLRGVMNRSQPQQVQLPMHTSKPISTEIQWQKGVNVPTENPFGPNIAPHESSTGSTDVQLPVHTSEPLPTEMRQLQGSVNVPTENALKPNEVSNLISSESSTGSSHVQSPVHAIEPLLTEMQRQGSVNLPTGTDVQLPVHNIDPLLTETQQQGSVKVPTGNNFRPNQGQSPSLQSWPSSYVQPILVQQTQQERTMLDALVPLMVLNPDTPPYLVNMQPPVPVQQKELVQEGPLNVTSLSSDALSSQPMAHSDSWSAQQVPMQMNLQRNTKEGYVPNLCGLGDQQAGEPTAFNAPPFTQPMNQPAFPGCTQTATQQQKVGGQGTTMAADEIRGSEAGSTSDAPFDEVMSDTDLAYAIELLKQYGVYSDVC